MSFWKWLLSIGGRQVRNGRRGSLPVRYFARKGSRSRWG